MVPTSDEQIRFLANVQRLLDEGAFVASYKFALLLALADLSVERGDDFGGPLTLSTENIAARFIDYYWRQAVPYPSPHEARVLQQNAGKQAAILNFIWAARTAHGDSLVSLVRNQAMWPRLVRQVARIVRIMPLWKLQTIGQERVDFLYENSGDGRVIELRPGVTYCLRKFHALISDQVRGAWLRYVRRQNLGLLGETADLNEFLFGSERNNLAMVRPILMDIQHSRCFYCNSQITGATAHVDHFVPWSRYPTDLGHNFVLADNRCNNQKRDRLPACEHLATWAARNVKYGEQLGQQLVRGGIVAELAASNRVTAWAYAQTEAVGGLTWLRADQMERLTDKWRSVLEIGRE